MRKRKIGLILLAICMLFTMSLTALAATKEVQEAFWFDLLAGGNKESTAPATKGDTANYARIEFRVLKNATDMPLYYRLRDYKSDEPASSLYTVNAVTVQRPAYWAGYGIKGHQYIFRIQTDSSSIGSGATTSGIWVP